MTYVQIKQTRTHQNTTFRNIQALLDMSQRSHNFIAYHYSLSNDNLFRSVPLFKQLLMQIKLNFLRLNAS